MRRFSVLCKNIVIINYTDSHGLLFTFIVIAFVFIFLTLMAEKSRISFYLIQVSFVVRYRKMISYTEIVKLICIIRNLNVTLITGNFESVLLLFYAFSSDAYITGLTSVRTEVVGEVGTW